MPSGPWQARTRRTACHARCGRLDAAWCHVAGCGHRLETVDAMTAGAEDEARLQFIPLGQQVLELLEHLVALPRPTWFVTCKSSTPSGLRVPWASGCPTDDIWQCMYSRAEGMASPRHFPRHCECDRPMAFSRRDLYLTMLNAILLQGNRTSPLVSNGPAPPPFIYPDGGVAVSVHVRGGDSCDIVVHAANRTTWGYWAPTSDVRIRRFCVHPSVHLAAVRALMASRNVRSVLLATDQAEAVDIFRPLEREGVEQTRASLAQLRPAAPCACRRRGRPAGQLDRIPHAEEAGNRRACHGLCDRGRASLGPGACAGCGNVLAVLAASARSDDRAQPARSRRCHVG